MPTSAGGQTRPRERRLLGLHAPAAHAGGCGPCFGRGGSAAQVAQDSRADHPPPAAACIPTCAPADSWTVGIRGAHVSRWVRDQRAHQQRANAIETALMGLLAEHGLLAACGHSARGVRAVAVASTESPVTQPGFTPAFAVPAPATVADAGSAVANLMLATENACPLVGLREHVSRHALPTENACPIVGLRVHG